MGTRNLTAVVQDGDYKVANYGQWDGYPSGQGQKILSFLLENIEKDNLQSFRNAVSQCHFITDEEAKEMNSKIPHNISSEDFNSLYPAFSRDTGGKILSVVLEGAHQLQNSIDFAEDSLFCEYAYVVDLDKDVLEVYRGFNKNPLSPDERFYKEAEPRSRNNTPDYYPIKHWVTIPFSELTAETMNELSRKDSDNEDEEEVVIDNISSQLETLVSEI